MPYDEKHLSMIKLLLEKEGIDFNPRVVLHWPMPVNGITGINYLLYVANQDQRVMWVW
jgi:hypothetical protein